ncbi:MAG: B3/4 domain-containing protein [Bacilli bacterium]
MNVIITKELTSKLEQFDICGFTCSVKVEDSESVKELVNQTQQDVVRNYQFSDLLTIPEIDDDRKGYKTLKADPNRVHLAVESLYRRILKGNDLYLVNNLVDIGNVLSIKTKRSVAVLDYDKIVGPVKIKVGNSDMEYYGIGRGKINITNLPIYCDDISPFGCPTSDTTRTMITSETKSILVMIICFQKSNKDELLDLGISLFEKYGFAQNIEKINDIKE